MDIMDIDLYQLVRELLTDYNDNFIGCPDQEIVEEVVECIDTTIDEDHLVEHILEIVDRLFEED